MTSFIRMPALRAALKAAAKLQAIKATRKNLWRQQIATYRANRSVWPWSKPLSDAEVAGRIRTGQADHPDHYKLMDEMRCKDVLALFKSSDQYIYLDATTLRAIT